MNTAIKHLAAIIFLALRLGASAIAQERSAAEEAGETAHYPLLHPKHVDWTFSGPLPLLRESQSHLNTAAGRGEGS